MLDNLMKLVSNNLREITIFAPLLAFIGGILTSIAPCSLPSVPLVIGFVSGTKENDVKRSFKMSVVFATGMAITYTSLGIAAALLNRIFSQSGDTWNLFLGVLMLLMALQTWEVINVVPSKLLTNKSGRTGYYGALVLGIMAGLFSSPCSTPILISLMAIVASQDNILWGILLFFIYAVGNSILVVVAGTSAGFVGRVTSSNSYGKISNITKILFGTFMLLVGLYFLYISF